jgi:glycosyltransferase involved in cell wall biosynthesis
MKIAFIGQKGIPVKIGGVERYVDEVSVCMAKRGHEVFVYVRNHYTSRTLKNYKGVTIVHVPTIKTKHLDAITHTFFATVHALFQGYDVINYQSIGPSSLSFIPRLVLRKTAVIATYHSQDYCHKKWGLFARSFLRLAEIVTYKIPDRTIAVGKSIRKYGIKKYNANSIFIPNGVTLFRKYVSLSIFKKWDLKREKYFLAVSRLIPHKEIHTLFQAFINLKAIGKIDKDFKLVIAGGGSYTDSYVKELKDMIRGRKDIILAGVQKGEKLATLYKNAQSFVQPSRSEGLSLALLEAMGMGLAPLVSDIPENLSAIGENGYVFRMGDVFDLMSKLENLIANPAKTKAMGEKARQMAKEEYNWDNIVSSIEIVYKDAILEKQRKAEVKKTSHILAHRRGTWL